MRIPPSPPTELMASSRTSPQNHHRLKLIVGAPLLVLSVGLHGLVLSLPMPAGWEEPEASPEAAAAPESVAVVPIPRKAQPAVPEANPSAQTPKAAARPVAPTPPTSPSPSAAAPVTPAPSVDQIEEQAEEQAEPPETPDVLLTPEAPPTLAELLQDPNSYTFNNSVKAAEVATSDFIAWYVETLSQTGDSLAMGSANLPPLRIHYPLETCLTPPPVEGRLGVVVDANGTVSQPPYILSSTGYSILDEQAVAVTLAKDYAFPASSVLTAYGLPVLVDYDDATCVPPQP